MNLTFIVYRKPLPQNHIWRKGPRGVYLTSTAREYKDAIRFHALAAARTNDWPKPEKITSCAVIIHAFNPHKLADCDAFAKLVLDALEGILFTNDRVVTEITQRKIFDADEPRIQLTVIA